MNRHLPQCVSFEFKMKWNLKLWGKKQDEKFPSKSFSTRDFFFIFIFIIIFLNKLIHLQYRKSGKNIDNIFTNFKDVMYINGNFCFVNRNLRLFIYIWTDNRVEDYLLTHLMPNILLYQRLRSTLIFMFPSTTCLWLTFVLQSHSQVHSKESPAYADVCHFVSLQIMFFALLWTYTPQCLYYQSFLARSKKRFLSLPEVQHNQRGLPCVRLSWGLYST